MNEFIEYDTCKKKPGIPILCEGCLNNRRVIAEFEKELERYKQAIRIVKTTVELVQD